MSSQFVIWDHFKSLEDFDAILLDQDVFEHFKSIFDPYVFKVLKIKAGEEIKSLEGLSYVINFFIKMGLSKESKVLIVGGGTLSDCAGFACSIYKRGVGFSFMPTTLLSMVDASIGGKNGINFHGIKNLLGTITLPHEIIFYKSFLKTLPMQEQLSGLGEILKTAIIGSKDLFERLNSNELEFALILEVAKIKEEITKADIFEKSHRHVLNFGHTVGHAYESCLKFKLPHGVCVAFGILVESLYSHLIGVLSYEDFCQIKAKIQKLGFRFEYVDFESLLTFLSQDKKTQNHKIRIHILEKIGVFPKLEEVDLKTLKQAYVNAWM